MKLSLAENIRSLRKQRKMTQEKLAEALGVTVGAVYKWESGQSQPELNLLVELADFFDTSVDVLLGYKMKNNSIDSSMKLISTYCQSMDPLALTEAEKALAKYPNSFQVNYTCASVYLLYGASNHDQSNLQRAQQLYEEAKTLLPQNDNPQISESIITGNQALALFLLGDSEKCIEALKQNNAGGIFNGEIGAISAIYRNNQQEAATYLSEALTDGVGILFTAVVGYVFLYRNRKDWKSAQEIIQWGMELLNGLNAAAKPGVLAKSHAELLVLLGYIQMKLNLKEEAFESLRKACVMAREFDATPDYSLSTIRFSENTEQSVAIDLFGAAAYDSIREIISLLNEEELTAKWKEITEND